MLGTGAGPSPAVERTDLPLPALIFCHTLSQKFYSLKVGLSGLSDPFTTAFPEDPFVDVVCSDRDPLLEQPHATTLFIDKVVADTLGHDLTVRARAAHARFVAAKGANAQLAHSWMASVKECLLNLGTTLLKNAERCLAPCDKTLILQVFQLLENCISFLGVFKPNQAWLEKGARLGEALVGATAGPSSIITVGAMPHVCTLQALLTHELKPVVEANLRQMCCNVMDLVWCALWLFVTKTPEEEWTTLVFRLDVFLRSYHGFNVTIKKMWVADLTTQTFQDSDIDAAELRNVTYALQAIYEATGCTWRTRSMSTVSRLLGCVQELVEVVWHNGHPGPLLALTLNHVLWGGTIVPLSAKTDATQDSLTSVGRLVSSGAVPAQHIYQMLVDHVGTRHMLPPTVVPLLGFNIAPAQPQGRLLWLDAVGKVALGLATPPGGILPQVRKNRRMLPPVNPIHTSLWLSEEQQGVRAAFLGLLKVGLCELEYEMDIPPLVIGQVAYLGGLEEAGSVLGTLISRDWQSALAADLDHAPWGVVNTATVTFALEFSAGFMAAAVRKWGYLDSIESVFSWADHAVYPECGPDVVASCWTCCAMVGRECVAVASRVISAGLEKCPNQAMPGVCVDARVSIGAYVAQFQKWTLHALACFKRGQLLYSEDTTEEFCAARVVMSEVLQDMESLCLDFRHILLRSEDLKGGVSSEDDLPPLEDSEGEETGNV